MSAELYVVVFNTVLHSITV